jgi:hypothetical protein
MYLSVSEAYGYEYIMQKSEHANAVKSLYFNKGPTVVILPSMYGSSYKFQDDTKCTPTDIETCVM